MYSSTNHLSRNRSPRRGRDTRKTAPSGVVSRWWATLCGVRLVRYLGTRLGSCGAVLCAENARLRSLSLGPRDESRTRPFRGTRRRNDLGKSNSTGFETSFLSKRSWPQTSARSSRLMRASATSSEAQSNRPTRSLDSLLENPIPSS